MKNLKSEYIIAWIKKAENDLKNVENNIKNTDEDIPTDTVCFHCQQAVEKYLKAYLTEREYKFSITHNLGILVKECMEFDSTFEAILEKAETLTPFAVEIRYPDDFYLPTIEETKEVCQIALEIKNFVSDKMTIIE